jgi:hypothetical protein
MKSRRRAAHVCDAAHIVKHPSGGSCRDMETEAPGVDPGSGKAASGFTCNGERIPLVNPQRGIFKPKQMYYLLSIRTVFAAKGRKVWYDDQTEAHKQIFASDETVAERQTNQI